MTVVLCPAKAGLYATRGPGLDLKLLGSTDRSGAL